MMRVGHQVQGRPLIRSIKYYRAMGRHYLVLNTVHCLVWSGQGRAGQEGPEPVDTDSRWTNLPTVMIFKFAICFHDSMYIDYHPPSHGHRSCACACGALLTGIYPIS